MRKCNFCDNPADSIHFDIPTCSRHSSEFEVFEGKKNEMSTALDDEMRVVERMVKLNPGLVKCPSCGGNLSVHHWKSINGLRAPVFKCQACDFMG